MIRKIQGRSQSFTPSLHPIVQKIAPVMQPVPQLREVFECGLEDYEVIRQLGRGSYATVYLGKNKKRGFRVAIKTYEKVTPQVLKNVHNEINVLRYLDHPNIVKLLEVRQESSSIHLVLEYVQGSSLENFVKARGIDLPESNKIFKQILSAIQYCHSSGVVHRDLKPSNILIDPSKKIKLIDFGFSSLNGDSTLKLYCGTPEFMAPELILQKPYNGQKVDMWALGVILHFLLTKKYPFVGRNEREILKKVSVAGLQNTMKIPNDALLVLRKLLAIDPVLRISAKDALNDLNFGLSKHHSYVKTLNSN